MTDTHGKGRKKEQEFMEQWGLLGPCWQPKRSMAYEGNTDIYGVGDFICLTCLGPVMVQVCHKKSEKRHRDAIRAWNEKHGPLFPVILETYS